MEDFYFDFFLLQMLVRMMPGQTEELEIALVLLVETASPDGEGFVPVFLALIEFSVFLVFE